MSKAMCGLLRLYLHTLHENSYLVHEQSHFKRVPHETNSTLLHPLLSGTDLLHKGGTKAD